jgi:hypothetical protein
MMFERFASYIISKKKPPKLPTTLKEINKFLIANPCLETLSTNNVQYCGTESTAGIKLRCPFCKSEFTGMESSGCFGGSANPDVCPVCNYPSPFIERRHQMMVKGSDRHDAS